MQRLLLTLACILFTISSANAHMVVVTVGNGGNFFSPSNFTIASGDTVRWVWIAGHHNTSAYSTPTGAVAWYSDMDHMTNTFDFIASISGLYKYTCTYHSGMDGQFFVTGCSYPSKPVVSAINTPACIDDTIILYTQQQPGTALQWQDGLTLIPGATTDTLKITNPGNYKVIAKRCGVDSVSNISPISFQNPPTPSYTHISIGNTYTFTNTTTPLAGSSYVWNFGDGSPEEYTTDVVHSFSASGIYTVTLRATDQLARCSDTFSTPIIYLGVGTTSSERPYHIYPNPVQSILLIESTQQAFITLSDLTGRIIPVSASYTTGKYHVDISGITPGIYTLNISDVNKNTRQKIVIQAIN